MRWSSQRAEGDPPEDAATDDPFGALVVAALDALPDAFRERLGSVAIVVEDEPTGEQLRSVGAYGLFGLYQGVPRTSWAADSAIYASKITIFRGPLIRASRSPEELALRVTDTVHHEIAHHFGISDDRLRELARPGG
jgi:predicted Zn-dependent protease with MMP-like domain